MMLELEELVYEVHFVATLKTLSRGMLLWWGGRGRKEWGDGLREGERGEGRVETKGGREIERWERGRGRGTKEGKIQHL